MAVVAIHRILLSHKIVIVIILATRLGVILQLASWEVVLSKSLVVVWLRYYKKIN